MEVDSAPGAARRRRERRLRQLSKGGGERVELRHGPDDSSPRRPKLLVEVRPQGRVQRRTVEQIVDAAPLVPLLDDPVPLTVDQLADVMRFFDTLQPVPEQAIEVPKILLDDVPVRTPVHDTQLVEQRVEVPTIISYSSLRRTTEQHVDIPVPHHAGRHPGSSSSSHVPARAYDALDAPGEGVFRTFLQIKKKVRSKVRTRVRECPARLSPSTPAPQPRVRLKEWVMIMTDQGPLFWNKDTGREALAGGGGLLSSLVVARWPLFRSWRLGCLTVAVSADFWWSPRGALFSVASSCSPSTGRFSASWFDSGYFVVSLRRPGSCFRCSVMLGPQWYMFCVSLRIGKISGFSS